MGKPDHTSPSPSPRTVMSMTSFPGAIAYATEAIKSLLAGSVLPDRLVLYVTLAQFGEQGLPDELRRLEQEHAVFEIRDYPLDIRSYRKLIPALIDFPDAAIVTVDDDVYYHRHMLRDLLRWHHRMPATILAHRAKRIIPGRPYRKWPKYRWYHFLLRRVRPSMLNLQTGVGGVLYPPHSLDPAMMDPALFTEIAPTTDDIWFWAAGVARSVPVMPVPFGRNKPKGLGKPRGLSLKTVNFKEGTDKNSAALHAIISRMPAVKERIEPDADTPIDMVYLWVDGSDPEWRSRHDRFTGEATQAGADCKGRYENHDELKYSLRSIHRYAPWIRRIYIVTDRQCPAWLDTSNPKIRIVDHTEILPPQSLPCFNSTVIEHHLHRIPGLSERFIYANDDMLLNQPVSPSDFFAPDGMPIVRLNRRIFKHLQMTVKTRLRHRPLTYYKHTLHTAAMLVKRIYGRYIGSRTHHNIDACLRSNHERAYALLQPAIGESLENHLRAPSDVQRNVYPYVALLEGRAHARYVSQRTSLRFHIDNHKKYRRFEKYRPVFFCMNDSEYANDADRRKAADFLALLFPDPSPYELPEA